MDLKKESVRTYAGLIWLKRKFSRGFLSTVFSHKMRGMSLKSSA
jgi:hypothetical protein